MKLNSINGMHRTSGNRALIASLLAVTLVTLEASCAEPSKSVMLPHPIISFQLRAEGETWALKFARLRKQLIALGAKDVPQVFLSADLAVTVVAPIKIGDAAGTAVVPGLVPLEKDPEGKFSFEISLKYVTELFGLSLHTTDRGYVIEFSQTAKTVAPH